MYTQRSKKYFNATSPPIILAFVLLLKFCVYN
nr:MAG TPA: hypothetical protein [Caudoviricetes sp.]